MSAETQIQEAKPAGFEGWADVQIMGHRQRTGEVTNQLVGDRVFVRIRQPAFQANDTMIAEEVEIYSPTAIFAIEPIHDEQAALEILRDRAEGIPF